MKKILFGLLVLISFQSFGQVPTGYQKRIVNERIQGSFMVDSAFNMPRYYDTTAANLHKRSDSCGAMFFSYAKDSVYYRACNPKRWITVGSGSGGGLSKSYAPLVISSGGDSISQRFNVMAYGADNTGVTDATAAIQAAQNACNANGGGVVFFPLGTYLVSSALVTSVGGLNPNSQLYINYNVLDSTRKHFVWQGETPPNLSAITWATTNLSKRGVIIKSTLSSTSGTLPAVIGTVYDGVNFNYNYFTIKNIQIQVEPGVTIGCINMKKIASVIADNIVCEITGGANVNDPTGVGNFGIITTEVNGETASSITNSVFAGFEYNVIVGEHLNMDQVQSWMGVYGYLYLQTHHASQAGRLGAYWCKYAVSLAGGPTAFSIGQLDIEANTSGGYWYEFSDGVYDPNNYATADINYWIVEQGVGVNNSLWSMNGGSGIIARSIGSGPAGVTLSNTQVAVGSGTNTISGSSIFTHDGETLSLGDINNSSAGVNLITATNSNASGKSIINLVGDAGSVGVGIFNSSFPVPELSNVGVLSSSNHVAIIGSNGVASGGSKVILFRPTGYDVGGEIAKMTGLGLGVGLAGGNPDSSITIAGGLRINNGAAVNNYVWTSTGTDGRATWKPGGFTNLTSFVSQNNWKTFYSNGSGDVTELSIGAAGTYLKSAGTSSAPAWTAQIWSKGFFLETPGSAEAVDMWQTPVAITVSSLKAILRGSTPSVTYNIKFGTDITSATSVFTSDITCTSVTTGCSNSSGFNDATIPAGSFIWIVTTASSGTINSISFTLNYTED